MKVHLSILICSLFIISCSKSEEKTVETPPIEKNTIGLKNYGDITGSYDESIAVF